MSSPVVVLMLKAPRDGLVKTRLAATIGQAQATAAYRRMVEHQFRAIPPAWRVLVACAPDDATQEMRSWLGDRADFMPQGSGDLGERLQRVQGAHFKQGQEPLLFLGGDCPWVDRPLLERAARLLGEVEVVVGPALDGGYYTIGIRQPVPELFDGITWSSATVWQETSEILRRLALTYATLPWLEDVDDEPAWRRAQAVLTSSGETSPSSCQ